MERFWSKVLKTGSCWEWTGCIGSGGYGMFRLEGRSQRAHRVAYTLAVGRIPDGLQIDHLCRNRACVNPDHLEAVTQAENIRRGLRGALHEPPEDCPAGHLYDAVTDSDGYTRCRTCKRDRDRAYKAKTVESRRAAARAYYYAKGKAARAARMKENQS